MPITVRRLSVTAEGAPRPLLDGISCELGDGEITLLAGRNGSGKSTLLDALGGLVAFDGEVRIDGQPLAGDSRPERSAIGRVGQVFQFPESQLFARTVQGEFDYSLRYLQLSRSETEDRTNEAMRELGLAPGLKPQSPLLLSGGEKRRVALASTAATKPAWLLLDEPTAGLDAEAAERLLDHLLRRKRAASGGIVVATHDLDLLLPVADRIVVLQDGRIVADMPASELAARPDVWDRAGLGMPLSVALAERMRALGAEPPAAFLTPGEAARLLAGRMAEAAERGSGRPTAGGEAPAQERAADKAAPVDGARRADDADASAGKAGGDAAGSDSRVPHSGERERRAARSRVEATGLSRNRRFVEALDPRAKWLVYMCVSVGLFAQRDWPGVGAGLALTSALMVACGVSLRSMMPILRPFLLFMAVSAIVSGIGIGEGAAQKAGGGTGEDEGGFALRFGAVTYSVEAALVTTLELAKIALVMVGGLLLSATTTPFAMKRGIERILSPLARIRFPVEAVSLTGSLLLRFIPVLRREAARFNRIAKSRGKRVGRNGTILLRDLPAMFVPLLLSLLQLASDLSLALEARGYALGRPRTTAVTLRMRRSDWLAAATGVGLLVGLLSLSLAG